jgi:hypothetical protein
VARGLEQDAVRDQPLKGGLRRRRRDAELAHDDAGRDDGLA